MRIIFCSSSIICLRTDLARLSCQFDTMPPDGLPLYDTHGQRLELALRPPLFGVPTTSVVKSRLCNILTSYIRLDKNRMSLSSSGL